VPGDERVREHPVPGFRRLLGGEGRPD
jgi:hypothetical protein